MTILSPELFAPETISAEVRAWNAAALEQASGLPNWWDIGAPEARARRRSGLTQQSERACTLQIPGPVASIALRIVPAEQPKGVLLHLHGGGWVYGASDLQDPMLELFANDANLTCVSVEYRLAPENPYPGAVDDCEAAALWLIENCVKEFGVETISIAGESAGAHLAVLTLLRLRDRHRYVGFKGAALAYGVFDLSLTPSARSVHQERLGIRTVDMERFIDAFLPAELDRRLPDVSPLFSDLAGLGPALFSVGTRDILLDDTLFMHSRWIAAGNQAQLEVYPGAIHGFMTDVHPLAAKAQRHRAKFLRAVHSQATTAWSCL